MKKTSFAKVACGLALMALSSIAMASVVNTKHNLGATNELNGAVGSGGSNHTDSTTEICIFCHTPHGGDQNTDAPIWNRARSSGAIYQRFSDMSRVTFDAKEAPIGSVSAACLSCHDGTQAMDALINTSGSDSPRMTSATLATSNANGNLNQNGFSQGQAMGNGSFAPADGSWDGVGQPRGDMVFLGTDLRNDHPISMQYGGGGIYAGGAATLGTIDPDFAQLAGNAGDRSGATGNPGGLLDATGAPRGDNGAISNAGVKNSSGTTNGSGTGLIVHTTIVGGAVATQDKWYVDTGTAGYQATDFPLYTRLDVPSSVDAAGVVIPAGTAQPTVECGTCHDPHSGNPTFLRLPGGNQSSQVCLTCHAK